MSKSRFPLSILAAQSSGACPTSTHGGSGGLHKVRKASLESNAMYVTVCGRLRGSLP